MRTLIQEMLRTANMITDHLKQLAIKSAEVDRARQREASVIISSDEESPPQQLSADENSNDLELQTIQQQIKKPVLESFPKKKNLDPNQEVPQKPKRGRPRGPADKDKIKEFQCTHCTGAYSQFYTLKYHMRDAHGIDLKKEKKEKKKPII